MFNIAHPNTCRRRQEGSSKDHEKALPDQALAGSSYVTPHTAIHRGFKLGKEGRQPVKLPRHKHIGLFICQPRPLYLEQKISQAGPPQKANVEEDTLQCMR